MWHFVPAGWRDADFAAGSMADELAFLRLAAEKVEAIRTDLGGAGEVIATQITQKMTGQRTDWRVTDAEIEQRTRRARLKVERDLARDLHRLTETLQGSRSDLNLTPDTVERVVRTGLRLAHRRELREALVPPGATGAWFRLPELPGAWAAARNDGLLHPVTGAERPVTFDPNTAAGRTDVVLLHLGHRLVQMCLRLLRAELWAQAGGVAGAARLSRVTARVVPGDLLSSPAVVAHGRVVITGAEGSRLHEEVVAAGGLVEAGRGVRARQEDLEKWLAAASDQEPAEAVRDRLQALWPELADPLRRALATRADQRARSLHGLVERRRDEEITAVEAVLAELATSIHDALSDEPHWEQPTLFEMERQQLHADRDALRDRLADLPAQQERETAALRRRYADPTTRWFPAAVTFLVPSALARGER